MQNLSDQYFEDFIKNKKKVSFTLLGGEIIVGVIKEKGRFCLVIEVDDRPRLLFKHAIHSIELPKTWTVTLADQEKEKNARA